MEREELPTLDPNAMCYMMSKDQYLQATKAGTGIRT